MAEGRYTKIKSRFLSDQKVRGWDNDTKFLALYLLTSPHNNILGCYILPKLYICADLGWTPEALAKPFAKLIEDGFIKYDEDACLILLTNYLKHNPIDNGNRAEGAIKILEELPRSNLFLELKKIIVQQGKDYLQKLAKALENKALQGDSKAFGEAFGEGFEEGNANPAHCTLQDPHCTLQDIHMSSSAPSVCADTTEAKTTGRKKTGRTKAKKPREEYSPEFEHFWSVYPRRIEKVRAFKAWSARLKERADPEDLIQAATNYSRYCKHEGIEERYIKHPATFLGPCRPFEDWINGIPVAKTRDRDMPRGFASLWAWAEEEKEHDKAGSEESTGSGFG